MKFIDFKNLKGVNPWRVLARFAVITLGCALYAIGVACFIEPNGLALGGFTGIAIILSKFIPINTGFIILIMNVPLLIVGLIVFGKEFLFSTVYSTVASSLMMTLIDYTLQDYLPFVSEKFMSIALGAVICAIGLSLIFRMGGTTGGIEIIARLIRLKVQNLSIGKILIMMDMVVILVVGLVSKDVEVAIYTAVTIIIADTVFDKLLYGYNHAKLLYIISENADNIRKRIISDVNAGVTVLEGKGGYKGDDKNILMVAVKKHSYPKLKDVIKDEDPQAFIIVSDATEIYGLNFQKNDKKEV